MTTIERTSRFEEVACGICRRSGYSLVYEFRVDAEDASIVRCDGCGTIRLSPRPRPECLGDFYRKEYYSFRPPATSGQGNRTWTQRLRNTAIRSALGYNGVPQAECLGFVPRWLAHLLARRVTVPPFRAGGRLLDIGCGSGERMLEFRRLGWQVFGVEISAEAAEIGRGLGLDIFLGNIEEAPWADGTFDAITLYHVLEHLPAPQRALARIQGLLAPDGVVIIAVPNFQSWERIVFGRFWSWLDVPIHLYHFDAASLTELLKQVELRADRIYSSSAGHSAESSFAARWTGPHRLLKRLKMHSIFFASWRLLSALGGRGGALVALVRKAESV